MRSRVSSVGDERRARPRLPGIAADFDREGADRDDVTVLKLARTLDPGAVEPRAVCRLQVLELHLAVHPPPRVQPSRCRRSSPAATVRSACWRAMPSSP